MPRPRMCRRVFFEPGVRYFKPAGVRLAGMLETVLTMDEFESIRLKDNECMDQTGAARKMGISQSTFQRVYESARKKIADALVNGKAIRIEGGHYTFMGPRRGRGGQGPGFGYGGRGMGRIL